MGKIGLGILLLVGTFTAQAIETPTNDFEARNVRTQLCDSWYYDFDARAYVCRWLGRHVNLVEARDFQAEINRLEQKIDRLERLVRTQR